MGEANFYYFTCLNSHGDDGNVRLSNVQKQIGATSKAEEGKCSQFHQSRKRKEEKKKGREEAEKGRGCVERRKEKEKKRKEKDSRRERRAERRTIDENRREKHSTRQL